jgi:signal transduction histidine kinase
MLPDPIEMVQHLQADAEMHRNVLSRALHDELGGLMISAFMDLASAEKDTRLNKKGHQRLTRARRTIASAIDFERRMVETLRPTLLDNFGLFAALRWQVDRDCRRAGILYAEEYPAEEADLSSRASIVLFRIVQDGVNVAIRQPSTRSVHISIDIDDTSINIRLAHDGERDMDGAQSRLDAFDICSMSHRVQGLGGQLAVNESDSNGIVYAAKIPLLRVTRRSGSAAQFPADDRTAVEFATSPYGAPSIAKDTE